MGKKQGLSKGFAFFWLGWVVIGGIMELVGLQRKGKGDTFSESEWAVTGAKGKRLLPLPLAWTLRFGVVVFLTWMIPHFFFGGRVW